MKKKIYHTASSRRDQFHSILSSLAEFYRTEADAAVRVALRHGATLTEISEEMGISRQAVSKKYPLQPKTLQTQGERIQDDETISNN